MKKAKLDPLVAEILSNVQPSPIVHNRLSDDEKIKKIAGAGDAVSSHWG